MADFDSDPGDTGGGTAVLESSPDSSSSSDDSSSSVGTTTDAAPGVPGAESRTVPYDRFDEINRKYKATQWAEQYPDAEQVKQRWALADWIDRDPAGFYRHLENQLRTYGYLQEPGQPQRTAQRTNGNQFNIPDPDYKYVDANGEHKFYSAEKTREAVESAVEQVLQRLTPIEQRLATADMHSRAQHEANAVVADAETWPYFEDFRQDIWQAYQNDRRMNVGSVQKLHDAYRNVVIPQVAGRAKQELGSALQQKPGATTTSPAQSQPQGSEDLSKLSIPQLFRREMRKRGMGT